MSPRPLCPLTGLPGKARRQRAGLDLVASYQTQFGLRLDSRLVQNYFDGHFTEYESTASGLRWFTPARPAGSDFYEFLASSLPWYYSPDTWDQRQALDSLVRLKCRSVFEAGSGGGSFLRAAAARGLSACGSEINRVQVAAARSAGFSVYDPAEVPEDVRADALVMLQVLEHVPRPAEFARDLIQKIRPRFLLVGVPAHDALIGRTTDPLVWPPHHVSLWSRRGLASLAAVLGGKLRTSSFQPLGWSRLEMTVRNEPDGKLRGLPAARHRRRLWLAYQLGRCLGRPWARRSHSVFGVIEMAP